MNKENLIIATQYKPDGWEKKLTFHVRLEELRDKIETIVREYLKECGTVQNIYEEDIRVDVKNPVVDVYIKNPYRVTQ